MIKRKNIKIENRIYHEGLIHVRDALLRYFIEKERLATELHLLIRDLENYD